MNRSLHHQYSDTILDTMRQTGDPAADKVVEYLFKNRETAALNTIFRELIYNRSLHTASLPGPVKAYFEEEAQLPVWAQPSQMKMGAQFFQKYGESILSLLGFLSLPYCYAAADGAQVLVLSKKIYEDPRQRLLETGQFVLDVMDPKAFEPEGKGFTSILKVRLMHATVRYHLSKSDRWNPDWGLPVNQEDMGGTNGSFSWLSLRGLRKADILFDKRLGDAYLHLWNVIGHLMGVRKELLPENGKAAFWLDKRIKERHFRKSEAGVVLTQSLLRFFRENTENRFPEGFIESYMRYLLGDDVADMLEVPPSNWTRALISPLKWSNLWQSVRQSRSGDTKGYILEELHREHSQNPVLFALPLQFKPPTTAK